MFLFEYDIFDGQLCGAEHFALMDKNKVKIIGVETRRYPLPMITKETCLEGYDGITFLTGEHRHKDIDAFYIWYGGHEYGRTDMTLDGYMDYFSTTCNLMYNGCNIMYGLCEIVVGKGAASATSGRSSRKCCD